jgi:ribosomal RNA-processing protein 17
MLLLISGEQLREERKQELEEHVDAVNRAVKEAEGGFADPGSDEEAWNGIEEEEVAPEPIDHEEEYIDEDKYTTVTVEAVDVSKEGLQKVVDVEEDDSEAEAPPLVETKDKGKKEWPKKVRKKKFRYESKVERKVTRAKQKFGNKSKADGRKGNN